uniref:BTB domain-containing protein n=1 Tax=Biomphalaria glabrata TaxID=6526 RepID=A0A2C9LAN8_BIOGL
MPLVHLDNDFEPKRSSKDVQEIITVLVRAGIRECQSYSSLCHSWMRQVDVFGRTTLHLAASFGKLDMLEWILEEKKVDLNQKDFESAWTALHRSLFYGQLNCARLLTQFNCDLQVRDAEGLSPLDMPMMDRPSNVTYSSIEPNEVYTWGEDHNSTLGHVSSHKRSSPEAVDYFKKSAISIKQVVLSKYHSVFLSQAGHVYTCGHGHGGRLGHSDQKTILIPRLLESVQEHTCLEIAAACDHTALRMAGGLVYTFGLNTYHQLGLTPLVDCSPIPKLMNLKPLKGKSISGVCVGRFHTVIWTPDSVFTVGLNAGQLGHQRGDKNQSILRQVSYLRHTDIGISRVACSDAATVCLTTKGDVYILHEYQCKKIASKWQDIEQVLVTGGNLDHNIGLDILKETRGQELRVLMKNEPGQIFLWRNSSPSLKRCRFNLKRQLWISDVTMTWSSLLLATERGETFIGSIPTKPVSAYVKDHDVKQGKDQIRDCGDGFDQPRLLDLLLKDEMEEISVKRVPYIHRAVFVAADKKGRDFAVVQALPNCCMTEFPMVTSSEINEQFKHLCDYSDIDDNISDAVIQVGNRSWPVHKYIISLRSDYFRNVVTTGHNLKGEKLVLKVDNISPEIMKQLIYFIYTDSCDYLQLGHKISHHQSPALNSSEGKRNCDTVNNVSEEAVTKGLSAFQVHQKLSSKAHKKDSLNKLTQNDESQQSQNPVKLLQEAARRFGVKGLSKRLDTVKCSSDLIISQGKNLVKPKVRFDRSKLPELYDVNIRSEDGEEIQCHKCVLVARLEYFYSMLSTGWVETFNTTTLSLPIPGQVLKILIDYLYCDEAPYLKDLGNEELLCSVLIVSDQLLASRLKEMCEVALADTITFKNVGELLEFSTIYNAKQLKVACQQFICLNLPAMLEGRYLDVLSQDAMEALTVYYRSIIPNMAYRMLTPETGGPYQEYIDEVMSEFETSERDTPNDPGSVKKVKQAKKVKGKVKKITSGEERNKSTGMVAGSPRSAVMHQVSTGSDVSTKAADDVMAVVDDLKKQAQEDDKKLQAAAAARSKDKMKWKPLMLQDEKMPPTLSAPTQPEAVPLWTGNMRTLSKSAGQGQRSPSFTDSTSVKPLVSPESPVTTSPTSLRDIMCQESQTIEKTKSNFSARISWKDVKKQQSKELKEKQQKQTLVEPSDRPQAITSPKPVKNPWTSAGSNVVKSLRDLMIQEEKAVSAPVPIPTSKKDRHLSDTSSIGSLGSLGMSPRSPSGDAVAISKSGGENPWTKRIAMAASPPPAAINFSAILKDEKEKSETLVRTQQKPLALIQLEERAMNELLEHYRAGQETDKYITVERVSKAMAVPMWHRDSKSVGHLL